MSGLHIYEPRAGFNRRTVEAMHDWTLANGLESELTYHRKPDGWEQRVRRPGESEPEFFNEMVAERTERIGAEERGSWR